MSTTTIPADRIQLTERAPRAYAAMSRLEGAIELSASPRHLVKVRASQINGCAFCLDMHWLDARADGESEARLYSLDAWRESTLYSDAVWEHAAEQFDEDDLAQLVFAIASINTWNRLMITARAQPGHYRPGMFA